MSQQANAAEHSSRQWKFKYEQVHKSDISLSNLSDYKASLQTFWCTASAFRVHDELELMQVAKMCTSLTYEHDECKLALQDQLTHNEKLLLKVRELEESLHSIEKEFSFSQSTVRF
jgi:hypothetical protein